MKYLAKLNHKQIDVDKILNNYIFEFQNPLHLSNKYLWIIKLYNFYLDNKATIIVLSIFSVIFIMMFIFIYKLRITNKKIETLFNKVPVAYAIGDIKTRKIIYANDYAKQLFKVDNLESVKNQSALDFHINEESYKEFTKLWQNYVQKHNTIEGFSAILQFKKKDGSIFWSKIYAVPYVDNQVIWIVFDVDELINTQHRLEKQMKVKEEFLANMSHEIRTPLNAILGFIYILEQQETNEENKKYLKVMKQSSKSLLNIINDILDFSKINQGKVTIEKIVFNPKELLDSIILFDSKAKEKNIKIVINTNNLDNYLVSDETKIKQIISNLVSNAIKFTPNDKQIICNINYNGTTEKLYFEIIDEGIGIPQDKLENIFNPFTQADNSTTRKYGGTGLGLSISYKLAMLLGGKLGVKSELDKGSVFYFTIPAIKIDEIPKELEDKNISLKGKILIVEDNDSNQIVLKSLLTSLGNYEIDIVNSGEEAIQKAKQNQYDLIFMDKNMPKMDGIKTAIKIKALGIKTPIIAVTADVLKETKEKILSVMDDYISKPIDENKLKQILTKYLKENND